MRSTTRRPKRAWRPQRPSLAQCAGLALILLALQMLWMHHRARGVRGDLAGSGDAPDPRRRERSWSVARVEAAESQDSARRAGEAAEESARAQRRVREVWSDRWGGAAGEVERDSQRSEARQAAAMQPPPPPDGLSVSDVFAAGAAWPHLPELADLAITERGDARPDNLPDPAIVLFCYNRAAYLEQTLASLARVPGLADFAVYISQDGDDPEVAEVARKWVLRVKEEGLAKMAEHWQRGRVPTLGESQPAHAWLAQHYGFGLGRVLEERKHSHAVVVEDDMLFSRDFLAYFRATAWLLEADASIWCVSSWNDNGFDQLHTWDPATLFRTSFFPGLGWMLSRKLWVQELGPRWPEEHWDHWMRMDSVAKGRDCVAPELSRTKNIGERGANMDAASFRRSLKRMAYAPLAGEEQREGQAGGQPAALSLDDMILAFGQLSYLLQPVYEQHLMEDLAAATVWEPSRRHLWGLRFSGLADLEAAMNLAPGKTVLVPYTAEVYSTLSMVFKLWSQPRGHYRYVARFQVQQSTVLVADRRLCPLLSSELRILPAAASLAVRGSPDLSCEQVCAAHGLGCDANALPFLNSCSALSAAFGCLRGCSVGLEEDLPGVLGGDGRGAGLCEITHKKPVCEGRGIDIRRLCACGGTSRTAAGRGEESKLGHGRREARPRRRGDAARETEERVREAVERLTKGRKDVREA